MAFIWSGAAIRSPGQKSVPLMISGTSKGSIHFIVGPELSQGIIEACKGTPFFRFGVDVAGHKVGLMFQGQEAEAWRRPRIDKKGRIHATLKASIFNVKVEDLRGHYADFHFDKNDQFWTADIRKRTVFGR